MNIKWVMYDVQICVYIGRLKLGNFFEKIVKMYVIWDVKFKKKFEKVTCLNFGLLIWMFESVNK